MNNSFDYAQCEEFYTMDDYANLCTAQLGGTCTGCGECAVEDCVDTCPQEGI